MVRERSILSNTSVLAAVAVPAVALLLWPYVALARQGIIAPHQLQDVRGWSASPGDFILPSRLHWLMGGWMAKRFDLEFWVESTVNVGLVSIALGIVGWWATRRNADIGKVVRACAIGGAVAFVLALGTDLHWSGRSVELPIPQLARTWLGTDTQHTWIPLPGYLLFNYLPFYSGMRVWMRWGIYVSLFLSVLAGLGFHEVTRQRSRRAQLSWTIAISLLVLMEFTQIPLYLTEVKGRPVDAWLAAQPGGTVAELPPHNLGSPQSTFYTMFHGHPFIGAFFSAFPSPQFRRIEPVLKGFPDAASIDTMKELGVRWVVVNLAGYADSDSVREHARAFGAITDFDSHMVLELR